MADPRLEERQHDERQLDERSQAPEVLRSWWPVLCLGAITAALGIVVAVYPTTSLNVVSVLLGVLLLVSGLLYIVRAIDSDVRHRGWMALAGLAFVVLGVVLVRHVHVTIVLIALLVGITWIVQGVVELMAATEERGATRTWLVVFGVVSLVAGIVVVAVPIGSVTVLTVLLGIWWTVLGLLEIANAFRLRHLTRHRPRHGEHSINGSARLVGWRGDASRRPTGSSDKPRP